jgi:hypothetical protein
VRNGIGATLREARNRRKIDLAEVEATTKIRARYLQAIVNEEWEVLPGGVYTRSFIRTYAAYLGLDGERLADDYRNETGPAGGPSPARAPITRGPARGVKLPSLGGPVRAAVVSLGLLAALLAVVLLSEGGDRGEETRPSGQAASAGRDGAGAGDALAREESRPGLALRLTASGEIWVCLLDAAAKPLVNGEILPAGAEAGPFRSDSFTVSFGNGEFAMQIDGKTVETPETSSPLGYEIGSDGGLEPLGEAERPTCT